MLSVISKKDAEKIVGYEFIDFNNFELKWTDYEDTYYIVNLLRKCRYILEIGTYLGHTTENIAKNTDKYTKIHTIDICQDMQLDLNLQNHEILTRQESGSHIRSDKVSRQLITSDNYFENNKSIKYDGIFIDGDHSYDQVKRDSKNALDVSKNMALGPITIVWHDVYNREGNCRKTQAQPSNMDVVRVLEELDVEIYKIERSWVGFAIC